MPLTAHAAGKTRIRGPIRPAHNLAQPPPLRIAGYGYGNPAVLSGAGITAMGRHHRVGVADADGIAPVGGEIQQRLGDGRRRRLGLRHINKLPLPGLQTAHQGGHYRENRMLPGGVIHIGNFRHHRRPILVAGGIGQPRGALGSRAGGPEVGPRAGKPITRGRHHYDVGLDPAQLIIFQPEIFNHPGREIFRKNIAYRD